jgi:hypothetical protein
MKFLDLLKGVMSFVGVGKPYGKNKSSILRTALSSAS